MKDVRVRFKKTGELKYISHLDLSRFMSRALKKTLLPVWHTEGFNPHIYLTFALPLSLGQCSVCETMDFRLTDESVSYDTVLARLKEVLPSGLEPYECFAPTIKAGKIAFADYEIILKNIGKKIKEVNSFFEQEKIETEKKTKRGEKIIDLKEYINILNISDENGDIILKLRLPAGTENNINPTLITAKLGEYISEDLKSCEITRIAVYTAEMKCFE